MSKHLIFEGAELSGKSWIMSQVYEYLEKNFNTSRNILNGCHWFNCDNGVFGTKKGQAVIEHYLKIFEEIKDKNIIIEKFFISDMVYNTMYNNIFYDYSKIKEEVKKQNFKLVFIKFPENIQVLEKRISDRLNLYPHYERILKKPSWYIKQQKLYQKAYDVCALDKILIETDILPDYSIIDKLREWI